MKHQGHICVAVSLRLTNLTRNREWGYSPIGYPCCDSLVLNLTVGRSFTEFGGQALDFAALYD